MQRFLTLMDRKHARIDAIGSALPEFERELLSYARLHDGCTVDRN